MNLKALVPLAFLFPFALCAQTNSYVTNWITPGPQYRMISNQVHDITRSPKWEFVHVNPQNSTSLQGNPPGKRIRLSVSGVVILNYPFFPEDFALNERGYWRWAPRTPCKAYLLSTKTNWGTDGKVKSVNRVYDYGLPVTNKIPVVTRRP